MKRSIEMAARELCMAFPEVEETVSHGAPDFRVRKKSFAVYKVNHHGDGHVALIVHSPPGVQRLYTELDAENYYLPAYYGASGWLGVELNRGLDWQSVINRVREAYENRAPVSLVKTLPDTIAVEAPNITMSPEDIDPFLGEVLQKQLAPLNALCASLPETSQTRQFGSPVWKAGKKTFVCTHRYHGRLQLQVWVGPEQQSFLIADERFSIPQYIGHRGWIDLDIEDHADWEEVRSLIMGSYRHFALQRMLKVLEQR